MQRPQLSKIMYERWYHPTTSTSPLYLPLCLTPLAPAPAPNPQVVTSNYMQHLDLARWQRHSLNLIIDDLASVLLSCLDFAETASDNATQRFYADYSRGLCKL